MSEEIKLKVPENPKSEFVAQGNFHAELKPNSTIEVTSRKFADFMIENYGLTEIKPKAKAQKEEKVNPFAASYPANFPGVDALAAAEIPYGSVQGLTKEQLVKIPNLGAATADQILSFKPVSLVPVAEENAAQIVPNASHQNDSAAGNEVNTGDQN